MAKTLSRVITVVLGFAFTVPNLVKAELVQIVGVWKADIAKSKFGGPQPPLDYTVRIAASGDDVTESVLIHSQRGESRSTITYKMDAKPKVIYYHGLPTRVTATMVSSSLDLVEEVPAPPSTAKLHYELSSDKQMLTISSVVTSPGKSQDTIVILSKQPDSAGAVFDKPEELASEHFKNVKTELKSLPESQFIDTMRYFAMSLGKDCEFCHVQRKFDSDDKEEKRTARVMIAMTHGINANTFEGKTEVRCFTCHEGHEKPQARPTFMGETPEDITKEEHSKLR